MSAEKTSRFSSFLRVLALARAQWPLLTIGLLALAGGAGINLLLPEIIRQLVNQGSSGVVFRKPELATAGLIALFAAQGLCFYLRSYFFGIAGQRVVATVRKRLYDSIIRQGVSFFDASRIGDLVSRLNSDSLLLQDAVSLRLSVLIRYSLQVVAGIALMSFISMRLTAAILVVLPILIGTSIYLGRRLKRLSRRQQEALGDATIIAEETFSNVRVVKAFDQIGFEAERFAQAADSILSVGTRRSQVSAFFASFVSFLMNASIAVILLYGLQLVSDARLSPGDLTAFLLYGAIVAVSFSFLSNGLAEMLQAVGAADRIFEILDRRLPPDTRDQPLQLPARAAIRGQVEFRSVGFTYPARPDIPVLREVSFRVDAATTTAIVGPSGAGKSTIAALLLRFYDEYSGEITLDGREIRDVRPNELRRHIAIVPQDPQFFASSIADNLRYGKTDASTDELWDAVRKANLSGFIEELPEGFETNIGHRGIQLSGGQKQRLAIARALLRDPALLILDEATSALDSENEHLVQEALTELMRGRTAIVIAHRLSTIKNADQVVVLDAGRIVQIGSHQSLSNRPGLYQQLVRRQELRGDETEPDRDRGAAPTTSQVG